MFFPTGKHNKSPFLHRIAPVLCMIFVLSLLCVRRLSAQTVATYNFEDATADGWSSFDGASTPVASNAAAYAGSYSLLTTTGSGGAGGPAISLGSVLLPGAKYTITGYVMLTSGESASNANFTIARTDPSCSGGTCYDTIGTYQVPITSSGWAQIGGAYTVSTTETGLNLYAQLVGATSAQSFYLDDVVITETAPPPGGTPVATYTFADGGLDGWSPFGSVDPDQYRAAGYRSEWGYQQPAGGWPHCRIHGAEPQPAEREQRGGRRNLSGDGLRVYWLLPDSSNPTATISTKTADCASSGIYEQLCDIWRHCRVRSGRKCRVRLATVIFLGRRRL